MTWTRLESSARTHAKLLRAKKLANKTKKGRADAVVAMWSQGLMLTNETGGDGFIPGDMLDDLTEDASPEEVASFLVDCAVRPGGAGLWERVDGGFRVHDFLEYNDRAEEVRARRKANAARMKAARAPHVQAHTTRTHETQPPHDVGTDSARSENVQSVCDDSASGVPARPRARIRSGPDPVRPEPVPDPEGLDSADQTQPQTDHADHQRIRTAYADAVSQATATLYPGIPPFAEEGMALDGFWRFERAKGASLDEFLKFLSVSVAMWVSEVRAKGETRFTGGWKPSKLVAWLADRDGPGLVVQPRSPATAVYVPPDTSDAVPAPKGFLDALAGIGGPSPKRGRA